MADKLKEIFEEAYELGLNTATQLLSVKDAKDFVDTYCDYVLND